MNCRDADHSGCIPQWCLLLKYRILYLGYCATMAAGHSCHIWICLLLIWFYLDKDNTSYYDHHGCEWIHCDQEWFIHTMCDISVHLYFSMFKWLLMYIWALLLVGLNSMNLNECYLMNFGFQSSCVWVAISLQLLLF